MSNPNTPQHKLDTPDFLAFSDSHTSDFCPSNTSSPQNNWRQSGRSNYSKSWSNRRSENFRGNYHDSPTASPRHRSFGGPYENFGHRRYGSLNHSFHSSFGSSRSRNDYSHGSPKNTSEGGNNILNYLHPSFMEDPWAKLEKQRLHQARTETESKTLTDSSSGSDEVPVET